jgi:serine/threonine protein kinase/WD40 repeat protein
MATPTPTSGTDLFNDLAHEFTERYRRGERPPLDEYTKRYPELADEILELFPTLVMMERLGSGVASTSEVTSALVATAPIPDRLGDFRIVREIGRGGMGIVYEAVQESLGRHVALKVLPFGHRLSIVQLKRFEREAKAAALLHHTNIVPVFGVGQHEGIHYYAMQYIQGQSLDVVLREVIRQRREAGTTSALSGDTAASMAVDLASGLTGQGSLTKVRIEVSRTNSRTQVGGAVPASSLVRAADGKELDASSNTSILGRTAVPYYRAVARAGAQAAEALDYAHEHGVLHRDIKPANLLLDLQGTLWVTDFGLAKAEGSDELTSPGDVVGTVRFMAPERFRDVADARSDVYSLGVTLYEMLTLKPAFAGSERATLIGAILHHEPVRPRKLDPHIPRDLETIVLKAIAKNPSDRFATAGEMARELGRFAAGRPIHSRRASVPERLWRWTKRNPAIAVLSLLAVSLSTALAIGSTAAAWKFREQRDAVRVEQQNTQAALGRSLLLQARALRYSKQPGRRALALETLAEAARIAHDGDAPRAQVEQLRDEVIATLGEVDERVVQTWPGLNNFGDNASFSFETGRYVVLDDNGFHLRQLSDQSEIRVVKPERLSGMSRPVLVAGGRFVIATRGLYLTELVDLELGDVVPGWPADVRCATPRADGKQVAALRSDGELRIYDLPALAEAARFPIDLPVPRRCSAGWMALSRDGRYVAFERPDKQHALVYEVASGEIALDLKTPMARVYGALALSRNGGLLAVSHDRAVSVYDVVDGERLSALQGHQSEGIAAQFQPDSDLLATQSWDGTTRLWDPIRGRLLVTLRGRFQGSTEKGSHLVVGRGSDVFSYQIAAADERRTIDCRMLSEQAGTGLYGPARIAYSPGGALIAMALRPEGVRIVRASDGFGLAQLPIGYCDEVLFLADGTLLTSNDRGLIRWPVRPQGRGLQMGPPEPLSPVYRRPGYIPTGLASCAKGSPVGVVSPGHFGSLLLDPIEPWRRTWITGDHEVNDLAMSPDGRWAATAGFETPPSRGLVKVWNVATGELAGVLPVGNARLAFSPDSQWLAVGSWDRCQFFKVGSWTPGAQFDHGVTDGPVLMAFHPGSQIVALVDPTRTVSRLADVKTGRLLASLEATTDASIHHQVFSPDGRYLATSHTYQRIDIWDLSLIRRRLEKLDLAAGLPDTFSSTATSGDIPVIERIEVQGGDARGLRLLAMRQTLREAGFALRGLFDAHLADPEELRLRATRWTRFGQWPMAAADFRASLVREPNVAYAANELAWYIAARPSRGDANEAVRWARKAVELGGRPIIATRWERPSTAPADSPRPPANSSATSPRITKCRDTTGCSWPCASSGLATGRRLGAPSTGLRAGALRIAARFRFRWPHSSRCFRRPERFWTNRFPTCLPMCSNAEPAAGVVTR